MIFPAFCGGALTCCWGDSLDFALKFPFVSSFQPRSVHTWHQSFISINTEFLCWWDTQTCRVFFLYNCAMYSFKPTKMLLLPSGMEGEKAGKSRLSTSWQVHRWTLKFHPCDCQCLVGPWVTEKKSCPQGYVCILERRWNSIGNVLSAVMLSFIYTLSSFDFWDVAAVSLLIPSLLYGEQLCKWISDFIVKKKKH